MTRPIPATGTLGPKEEVVLSFKVGGVISEVRVDAGETVRQGQPLASLDPTEIEAALSRARAAAAKAERELERARRLHADSVVTRAQLEDAWTAAEVARADLEAARFNRRFAEIQAPADGSILRRLAEPGETVESGAPILVLGSRSRGSVIRLGLADRDVVRVRVGDEAVARFDAFPGRTLKGRVTDIGSAAQPGTGTYAVEVALDGDVGSGAEAGRGEADPPEGDEVPDGPVVPESLRAGLIARVEIQPRSGPPVKTVPVEAILEADDRRATVFVLSGSSESGSEGGIRALRRRVTIGAMEGDRVAVLDGLDEANSVVTEGAAWLSDGEVVRVLP